MAEKAVQIQPKTSATQIPSQTTPAPTGSQTLSPTAPRQIMGPGEMVVIQPGGLRTTAQPTATGTAKRVAPMDATLTTVKLDTNEYVAKTAFDGLTASQQAYLKKYGIDAFNKESGKIVEEAQAAFELAQTVATQQAAQQAAYEASMLVKLNNGEFVTKDAFGKLTPEQQQQLMVLGVNGFNQWAKTQTTSTGDTVKLNTGEFVTQAEFNKLTPTQQQQLMSLGVGKFNEWVKTQTAPVTTTTPANTVKLDNGDLVGAAEFAKLPVADQQKLKSLGVDGYNAYINSAKAMQQSSQSALYDFALSQLPPGFYGPAQITGQTILDYLAANRNSPDAQATIKAAGYDITTPDAKTGLSLSQIAAKIVTDRDKVGNEIQAVLTSGKGADGLISAIQNAGYYDDSKFNATPGMPYGSSVVIWVDKTTGKALTNGELAQRLWNSLTPSQKAQVTDTYGADVYRSNYFSEQVKIMAQFAEKGGIVGQLIFGPLLTMETPIAKVLVNQPVSAQEWAAASATAIVSLATFGGPPVGGIVGFAGQVLVTGAAATLTGLSIEQTVKNWGVMSTPERVLSVATDVIGLAGTIVSGISTVKAGIQVLDTMSTTRAAIKAGNAYDSMIRTLDKANVEAASRGLVSADTNTRVQLAISESRAADGVFLDKFGNLDKVSVSQLDKFEKLSGYRGLSQAVQDLTEARTALDAAWRNVAAQKDPVAKVQALTDAQAARDAFFGKLNDLGDITTPRTGPVPSVVWDNIIDVTKADIQRIQQALAKEKQYLATKINPDMTEYNELKANLDVLNKNLDTYVQSKAGGGWQGAPFDISTLQGDVARAQLRIGELQRALGDETLSAEAQSQLQTELISAKNELARAQSEVTKLPLKQAEFDIPKDLNTELNDFLNHQGKYSPEYQAAQRLADDANARTERMFYDSHGFWPSGSPQYPANQETISPAVSSPGTVAVVEPAVTPAQMSLDILLQDVISQPTPAEPRMLAEMPPMPVPVVPGIGTSVIPAPLVVVTPAGLAPVTYAAKYIADMTPEQVTQVFGDQVKIQPVVTAIPEIVNIAGVTPSQVRGIDWVSPADMVKIAQATDVATYVQAIMAQAAAAVNKVLLVTDDNAALREASKVTIQTYLDTITNPALREAVEQQINALNAVGTQLSQATAVSTAQQTATRASVQTATQIAQQTATQVQEQTATKIMQKEKTITAVEPATEVTPVEITPIEPVVPILPFIPPLPDSSAKKRKVSTKKYPDGTAIWKMGFVWKIIPPPYIILKPISTRTPPVGVTVLKGSPQETLTFLGGVIPHRDISFDLGVVDGYIDVKAKKIIFTGGGLGTKVGLSLPEPTKGITFPSVTSERVRAIEMEQRNALGVAMKPRKRKVRSTTLKPKTPNMLVQTER